MKTYITAFYSEKTSSKLVEWGKLIAITGGAQAVIQAAGLICGIVIIRLLSTQEYAIYTLANAMLSTITLLADAGVTTGVMSEGSQVWTDKTKLGVVLSTGLNLRKKFAIITLIIVVPIMAYLLIYHHATILNTTLIILAFIPAFLASLSDSIYEIPPKLHQDVKPLQRNQLIVSMGRLALSGLSLLVFPLTFIAFIANALPRIYGNLQLKKIAAKNASENVSADPVVTKNILKIVKRSLPTTIFYCISGQLTIWLISVFGQTKSIATIGAISRLSMITTVVGSVYIMLIIPRFARLPRVKSILAKAFIKIHFFLYLLCVLLLLFTTFASHQLLSVLGDKYLGFKDELFLSMLGSCIVLLVGGTINASTNKGWVMHPVQSISISLFSIIVGLMVFDVSNLKGVLYMNIFIAILEYLNQLIFLIAKINRITE